MTQNNFTWKFIKVLCAKTKKKKETKRKTKQKEKKKSMKILRKKNHLVLF